jgi:hypothetical protein
MVRILALAKRATIACLAVMTLAGCGARVVTNSPVPGGANGARDSTPKPAPATTTCTPSVDDGLSPTYRPGAPVRAKVGHGHVLTGIVVSSLDCAPIAEVKIELWPEYSGKGHPDTARATVFTDSSGRYRFECDPPEHIHMRISAPGYVTIAQNSYHPNGSPSGAFDVVLRPDAP